MIHWKTEKRFVKDLKEYEYNPRQISEEQFKQLKESLDKFGYVEIVAINTDNTIIAGHMRIRALKALGRYDEQIEVRVPSRELSKQEFEEYLVRSNKNTGEWDIDILANHFENLDLLDWGFSEKDLGLSDVEPKEEEGKDESDKLEPAYQILIECEHEEEQVQYLEKLQEMGIKCRALVL